MITTPGTFFGFRCFSMPKVSRTCKVMFLPAFWRRIFQMGGFGRFPPFKKHIFLLRGFISMDKIHANRLTFPKNGCIIKEMFLFHIVKK